LTFPVSGVEIPLYVPPVVAFLLGTICATAGVSGAFLLLPFQVSVLGFTAPAVSPTNLLFNVFGIPGGVYRFFREGRLDWWLAGALIAGYLPGMFLGMLVRILLLPDPRHFKLFIAVVLLYLAWRMFSTMRRRGGGAEDGSLPVDARLVTLGRSWGRVRLCLGGLEYEYRPWLVAGFALLVGVVGGAYGIGGGALMAPVFISVFRLPVHAMAGANLLGTMAASLLGIVYFTVLGPALAGPGVAVRPDWLLGGLFGLGGLAGIYCGAWLQRFLPARAIKCLLGVLILLLVARYLAAAIQG